MDTNGTGLNVGNANPAALSAANSFVGNTTGVRFANCVNPSVSNQTMTGNSGALGAIFMDNTGSFHIGTGNVVTGNSWGLSMSAGSAPDQASLGNLPIAGNTNVDGMQVSGGTSNKIVTWRDLGVDFIVTLTPTISSGGSLTIEDGCVVRFEHGAYMNISGTLNAAGSTNGILFTRRDPTDEWWGLWHNSGSSGSFTDCTIERATFSTAYGINANGATSLSIQDTQIHDCDHGVYASNTSPSFIRCQITGNSQYGILLNGACNATFGSSLSEWNDVFGNGAGNSNRDLQNGTLDITAAYVYWGVLDEPGIQSRIQHEPDNATLGLVAFSPWTNSAHNAEITGGTAVGEIAILPTSFALSQNRPNPIRSDTGFEYALPQDSWVKLEVFDVAGRRVETLVDGFEKAGFKRLHWNAGGVASGTYLYRLQAGDFVQSRRLVIVR
jgi:hypothetical protein